MDMIPGLSQTASALDANKQRLEIIAQNIANAQTTQGLDGEPYQRRGVSFASVLQGANQQGVEVQEVFADDTPGPTVYNPSHPHADGEGMVRMPNVQMAVEMVDMISASRAYQANLSASKISRQMAESALRIGQ
jgi:flagellar basal-body rod protein FlgC